MKTGIILLFFLFSFNLQGQLELLPHDVGESEYYARDVAAGQIDGVLGNDIITVSGNGGRIQLHKNVGDFQFESNSISSIYSSSSIKLIDIEFDGDLDILSSSGAVILYDNDGSGCFSEEVISDTTISGTISIDAFDIDNDGDLDIVSGTMSGDIYWYENTGDTFVPHILSQSPNGGKCIQLADLDGDNDIDILTASSQVSKILWLENDGDCNFSPHTIVSNTEAVVSISVGDLDNDGDMDFAYSAHNSYYLKWRFNNGSGAFQIGRQRYVHSWGSGQVIIDDLDSDGLNDLIMAHRDTGLFFLWNLDNGDFEWINIDDSIFEHYVIDIIDIDEDSDKDIVCGFMYNMSNLLLYENLLYTTINNQHMLAPNHGTYMTNSPNPFNPTTAIKFHLNLDSDVVLEIYNIIGQKVKLLHHGYLSSGHQSITWDGKDEVGNEPSSGIYFARLEIDGEYIETMRLLLIK